MLVLCTLFVNWAKLNCDCWLFFCFSFVSCVIFALRQEKRLGFPFSLLVFLTPSDHCYAAIFYFVLLKLMWMKNWLQLKNICPVLMFNQIMTVRYFNFPFPFPTNTFQVSILIIFCRITFTFTSSCFKGFVFDLYMALQSTFRSVYITLH